jgi:hypothetical protein
MSTHVLLFHWAKTWKKYNQRCWYSIYIYKADIIFLSSKCNLFSPLYSWIVPQLVVRNNHYYKQSPSKFIWDKVPTMVEIAIFWFQIHITNGLNSLHWKWRTGNQYRVTAAEIRMRSNLELLPVMNVKKWLKIAVCSSPLNIYHGTDNIVKQSFISSSSCPK